MPHPAGRTDPGRTPPLRFRLIAMFATFLVACSLSHFLRSSHVVIAPSVIADLGLSAEAFGLMGSAFFFAYALGQIPTGLLLDSVGPRRTVTALLGIAVAGTALFATADSLWAAAGARFMMGIGCAAIFMSAFFTAARWLGPERFGTASGLISGLSHAGNLLAATPLALLAGAIGWRASFWSVAAVLALVGAMVWISVRDWPDGQAPQSRPRETAASALSGLAQLLRWRPMHHLLAMALVCYACFASVFSLWAGPYLFDVHGLDPVARGNIMLAMAVAAFLGSMLWGMADRVFNTRRRLVIVGALCTAGLLGTLALWPAPPVWAVAVLLPLFCASGSYSIRVMIHGRALFPEHLAGRGMTTVNLGMALGAAVMQPVTGVLLGAVSGGAPDEAGYRAVFGFLAVVTVVALAFYAPIEDAPPRPTDT